MKIPIFAELLNCYRLLAATASRWFLYPATECKTLELEKLKLIRKL